MGSDCIGIHIHCKTIEIEKKNEREKHVNSFSRFELFERGLIVCVCALNLKCIDLWKYEMVKDIQRTMNEKKTITNHCNNIGFSENLNILW